MCFVRNEQNEQRAEISDVLLWGPLKNRHHTSGNWESRQQQLCSTVRILCHYFHTTSTRYSAAAALSSKSSTKHELVCGGLSEVSLAVNQDGLKFPARRRQQHLNECDRHQSYIEQ